MLRDGRSRATVDPEQHTAVSAQSPWLSLQSYGWPSRIQAGDVESDPVFPGRGIVTGCAFATTELRTLLSISLSYHFVVFPRVQLAVFVDDLGFDFCSHDEREARSAMVASIIELDRVLVEDLQLALAHDKTLVVASSKALATSVARDLEDPASRVVSTSAQGNGADGHSPSVGHHSKQPNAGWGASRGSGKAYAKEGRRCSWLGSRPQ